MIRPCHCALAALTGGLLVLACMLGAIAAVIK